MLTGTCPAVRISNCDFDRLYQSSIYTFGWIYGVMDNCLHTITNHLLTGTMGMATYNGKQWGDGSWMEAANWGSYKFFFMENNVVAQSGQRLWQHGRETGRSLCGPLQ